MIYVLLADGFEEIEAIEPIDIMRRAKMAVATVGLNDKSVKGAHGIVVDVDILIDDVKKTDMEMLMLPGGAGHTILDADERVQALIDYAFSNDLYIGAICASPSILGKKGLLKGKKVTCFPGFEQYLDGAEVVEQKAVCDGKIITGKGAGAAGEFGLKIVEVLRGRNLSDELKRVMQY